MSGRSAPQLTIRRWRWADDVGALSRVVERGGLLAIPTESSYGLAVDPRNRAAVATVYGVKRRAGSKPLPVVVADLDQLGRLGISLPVGGLRGLEKLWPGPLSILFDVDGGVAAAAGSGKLAVRVPAHAGLRGLLKDLGMGLTATSANASGKPPITDPAGLDGLLAGRDAMIVDDGPLPGGSPSTLVALAGDVASVLRRGRLSLTALRHAAPALEFRGLFSAGVVEIPVEDSR